MIAAVSLCLFATAAFAQDPAAGAQDAAPADAAAPAAASQVPDPNTYKPRTEHDNAPYRFNMHQEGRQMTADEFDAWMKARGVRVARGAGQPAAAQVAPAQPAPQAAEGGGTP
ncbi:hypothetical protein FKV25_04425 [Lysobacter aestuarii]|uniref:Uncharacterized protein n=1 Tax=Marilutibacter aestuarii TaxID=1706195 RepID=A0A508AGK0_9GAMM|nr:hypothetical protein FKV25_04425 [Lysobacter aestuarii]